MLRNIVIGSDVTGWEKLAFMIWKDARDDKQWMNAEYNLSFPRSSEIHLHKFACDSVHR